MHVIYVFTIFHSLGTDLYFTGKIQIANGAVQWEAADKE